MTTDELREYIGDTGFKLNAIGRSDLVDAFSLLYQHGFRAEEIALWKEWVLLPNNQVQFPTLKKGNVRTIDANLLRPRILNTAISHQLSFDLPSYKTMDNYFNIIYPKKLKNGRKPITTHAFRHLYVKTLYQQGFTPEFITQKMGLVDPNTVLVYITSNITYL